MNAATTIPSAPPLLEVEDLEVHFQVRRGLFGNRGRGLFGRDASHVRAVDGVSFVIAPGETLGLVGESGCGKTTLGRAVLRLVEATAGRVRFEGIDLLALRGRELRALRRRMQIVFQDPWSSLNPRMTVGQIVGEGLVVHQLARGAELARRIAGLLEQVGLPAEAADRYPHEFSGGQRQRVGIARALAVGPRFVVCDESVSALDVSVQAQMLNLLVDLRERFGLAYLFIAHDLAVVRHLSHRVAVMYLGEIVEIGPADEVLARPRHPYTQALLAAVPQPDAVAGRARIVLKGELPSPLAPPAGCRFHPRCPFAEEQCRRAPPPVKLAAAGHEYRCIL